MSLRDTLLQLAYVLIAGGSVFATWALLTGPLGRYTGLRRRELREGDGKDAGAGSDDAPDGAEPPAATPAPEASRRSGSKRRPS